VTEFARTGFCESFDTLRQDVREVLGLDFSVPRKRAAESEEVDEILHDLISVWHDADGIDGIELHQFLGCTEAEYAAWFGPDPKPLPPRLHGYWRWLHDRVWTGPGHEVRWAGRMMREVATALGTPVEPWRPSIEWEPLLQRIRALTDRHINREDPGGPEDGHTFEVAVRSRGASSIVGVPGSDEDSNWWSKPVVAYFRASSLPAALHQANELPFTTWMSHVDREEPPA
jgi:hypothetical protein